MTHRFILSISIVISLFLTGCIKSNDSNSADTTPTDISPPFYGLSLNIDTVNFRFNSDQMFFSSYQSFNRDPESSLKRQYAYSIYLTAKDSVKQLTITMNVIDLIPGDYILDGQTRVYYFIFDGPTSIQTIPEHYSGSGEYSDENGSYTVSLAVTFYNLDLRTAWGQFSGTLKNALTQKTRSISGEFYR